MDAGYWVIEYGKVLFSYLFLMFLWPSVVFRGHLRTKSKTYWFSFCVTVTIVLINSIVLTLGLFHVLDQRIVFNLFYGVFAAAFAGNILVYIYKKFKKIKAGFPDIHSLYGKYRAMVIILLIFVMWLRYIKQAVLRLSSDYGRRIKSCNWNTIRRSIRHKTGVLFWKYGLLTIVLLYGMVYFSYGAFQVQSYGAGDLYTHHKWTYELIQGNIFQDGIYPEAMHCFIYCMNTLFGVRIYSILLFLQGIHVAVLLLSVYVFLRRVLYWRYSPLFVLMLFLTLDLTSLSFITNMSRLQNTLPQEFGLHTIFLSALYLVNYLYKGNISRKTVTGLKQFWNEELFLLMVSMAAAAMIHFFVVIMACIVCCTFAVFNLKRLFIKRILIPLLLAALCACVISVAPYAGALAQGMKFNGSINWAIDKAAGENNNSNQENVESEEDVDQDNSINSCIRKIIDGYIALYGRGRTKVILFVTAIMIVCCCLFKIRHRFKPIDIICSGYYPLIMGSVLFIIICSAPVIGLPDFIPEGRFFVPGHMMLLAIMIMPIDLIFYRLKDSCTNTVQQLLSGLVILGIYVGAIMLGSYRGFLFYELSRYSSAVNVTNSIIDTFPEHSYTIVSPTEELYPVIQYGWHEELLTFIEESEQGDYTIPTENVFIYIEKRPLIYAQRHFFDGPFWLGEEKYSSQFLRHSGRAVSKSPEIKKIQISEAEAQKDLPEAYNPWLLYKKAESRVIIESKAFEWCQRFMEKYPSAMNVFYEDDDFVCYFFKQDINDSLYNLNL